MTADLRIERVDAQHARVSGRLGFHEAGAAADRWRELVGGGAGEVAVDIGGIERVDSATLAVLLDWAAKALRAGTRLRLTGVPADLTALAHLSGTESMLGIGGA